MRSPLRLAPSRPVRPLARGMWVAGALLLAAGCKPPGSGAITGFTATPANLTYTGGTVTLAWKTTGTPTDFQLAVTPTAGVTIGTSGAPATKAYDAGTATSVTVSLPGNTEPQEVRYHFALSARFKDPTSSDVAGAGAIVASGGGGPGPTGAPGTQAWLTQFGSAGNDTADAVATDMSGNIAVAGYTDGTLGGAAGTGTQAFVAELDPTGKQRWLEIIGTAAAHATAVAFDQSGNVYVTGSTSGDMWGTNLGGDDVFLAAYDPTGTQLWITQFGTGGDDEARGIGVDVTGNVDVTGVFTGNRGTPNGDVFLAQYLGSGGQAWLKTFGTGAFDDPYGLAVDPAGDAIIAGSTQGNFGGTNAGQGDVFLAMYDTSGSQVWVKQFGTAGDDGASSVAVGSGGNIVLTGWAGGNLGGTGSGDMFVAEYDFSGKRTWLTQLGTTGDQANGVAMDSSDNIAIAGSTTGSLNQANAGLGDAFAARFDPSGKELWISQLGTAADDAAYGVATDQSGHVILAGSTGGQLGAKRFGQTDAFVGELSP